MPEAIETNDNAEVNTSGTNGFGIAIGLGVLTPRISTNSIAEGVPISTAMVTVTFDGRFVKETGLVESNRTALYNMLKLTKALGSPFGTKEKLTVLVLLAGVAMLKVTKKS
jgi:hypothetical protein